MHIKMNFKYFIINKFAFVIYRNQEKVKTKF